MKSASKTGKAPNRRQFVSGWFPVNSPSTQALIWRSQAAGEPVFVAEISRRGEKIGVLKASTAEDLAGMLIQEIGPAPRSLIRLVAAGSAAV